MSKQTFFIQITTRKEIRNEIPLADQRKAPTCYLQCYEMEQKIIQVVYAPGAPDFDKMEFKKSILKSIKKQYPRIVDCTIMDENPLLDSGYK